jgi:hypothetical protein
MKSFSIAQVAFALSMTVVFGCGAPKPEEVCGHLEEVFAKDPAAAKFKKFDKANCMANGDVKKELPAYKTYAKCVKSAQTIEGINVCAKAMDDSLK